MSMTYIVDTNEWINLNKIYPKEIFPTLWGKVEGLISEGRMTSPSTVRDEIERGHDELVEWAKMHPEVFRSTDVLMGQVRRIVSDHRHLIEPDERHESADPHIIALAISIKNNLNDQTPIIVTDENERKQSRIPYVASTYGVPACKLLEMIRGEGWVF